MRMRHVRHLCGIAAAIVLAVAWSGLATAAGDPDGSRGPAGLNTVPAQAVPVAAPAPARKGKAATTAKKKKKKKATQLKRRKRSDIAPPAGQTPQPGATLQQAEAEPLAGYRAARALVLAGKYEEAIVAFKALHHDEHPEVANYLGFASRKLGHYDEAKVWYEKALAADPNHTRTWQYYGMWHLEQGNVLKARDHLDKIRSICGNTTCSDYVALKGALEGNVTY